MTIEQLTDDVRARLALAGHEGPTALRIIDAHAAERAALVAQVAELTRERDDWRQTAEAGSALLAKVTRELDEARTAALNEARYAIKSEDRYSELESLREETAKRLIKADAEVTRLTKALAAAERAMREANRVSENAIRSRDAAEALVRELEAEVLGLVDALC